MNSPPSQPTQDALVSVSDMAIAVAAELADMAERVQAIDGSTRITTDKLTGEVKAVLKENAVQHMQSLDYLSQNLSALSQLFIRFAKPDAFGRQTLTLPTVSADDNFHSLMSRIAVMVDVESPEPTSHAQQDGTVELF